MQSRIKAEWEEREKKAKEAAEEKRKAEEEEKARKVKEGDSPLKYPVSFTADGATSICANVQRVNVLSNVRYGRRAIKFTRRWFCAVSMYTKT